MTEYTWTKELDNGKYTIKIAEPDLYGYFEHNTMGEDRGGGLWFQVSDQSTPGDAGRKLELIDYDGVCSLPKSVATSLQDLGIIVGEEFLD